MTSATKQSAAAAASSAMVPRVVDGWPLFHGVDEPGWWVKDLGLGEHAELKVPHDIRRTIAKALKDKALTILGSAQNGITEPAVRVVQEVVALGSGASKAVDTYYLNLEGAVLILGRLRTAKAIEATKAVVMVFAKALRGEMSDIDLAALCARLANVELLLENSQQEVHVLRGRIDLLDPTTTGLAGDARAGMIRNCINEVARLQCLAASEADAQGVIDPRAESRRRKEQDNELRRVVQYVCDIGQGWEKLPVIKFGDAMAHLQSVLARAKKDVERVRAKLESRVQQMALVPTKQKLRVIK